MICPASVRQFYLEENGSLSVFPKSADRPLTAKDMSLSLPEDELAAAVVIDGKIMHENLKTMSKKADLACTENAADKEAAIRVAIKKVDQACAKGLLHKNAAARKKSQLAKKLNAAD